LLLKVMSAPTGGDGEQSSFRRQVMRILAGSILLVSLAAPLGAHDDEARAILRKAVAAHGGAAALGKSNAFQVRHKGTMQFLEGASFSATEHIEYPSRYKGVMQIEVGGVQIPAVRLFNGEKGWTRIMDEKMEMDDDEINELKDELHEAWVQNPLVEHKGFTLSPLGAMRVKDRDSAGVRVSYQGRRDVNLFFDASTGLLVKSETRAKHPITEEEGTQEQYLSDYRAVDGIKCPHRLEVLFDGKSLMEVEILEIRLCDKHDAGTFDKP
jgi:hypothetical protein